MSFCNICKAQYTAYENTDKVIHATVFANTGLVHNLNLDMLHHGYKAMARLSAHEHGISMILLHVVQVLMRLDLHTDLNLGFRVLVCITTCT